MLVEPLHERGYTGCQVTFEHCEFTGANYGLQLRNPHHENYPAEVHPIAVSLADCSIADVQCCGLIAELGVDLKAARVAINRTGTTALWLVHNHSTELEDIVIKNFNLQGFAGLNTAGSAVYDDTRGVTTINGLTIDFADCGRPSHGLVIDSPGDFGQIDRRIRGVTFVPATFKKAVVIKCAPSLVTLNGVKKIWTKGALMDAVKTAKLVSAAAVVRSPTYL